MAPRKKPARKWRDPSGDPSRNWLEIIGAMEGLPLQSRWSQSGAHAFARQALGVAAREAIKYQKRRSRDQLEYWNKTADLSSRAASALQQLIEHASPDGVEHGLMFPNRTFGQYSLKMTRKRSDGRWSSKETSKAELALLIETQAAIKNINAAARKYGRHLSTSAVNEPEHDKHAFVFRLAEAWVFLTGSLPGLGTERSPFSRFVEAAALDAGLGEENFRSATKAAVSALKEIEGLASEDGGDPIKNKQTISYIRKNGPRWLT